MFSSLKLVTFTSLAILAVATSSSMPASQCNTGDLQCCNSTQSASSDSMTGALGLLGISASSLTGLVGSTCSPITVIGAGSGASCNAQPVCCTDNSFNGLIALGCTPVDLSL